MKLVLFHIRLQTFVFSNFCPHYLLTDEVFLESYAIITAGNPWQMTSIESSFLGTKMAIFKRVALSTRNKSKYMKPRDLRSQDTSPLTMR